ncbi:MAG: hypothetical protein ACYS4W_00275 [Planctomycetota bacterium]
MTARKSVMSLVLCVCIVALSMTASSCKKKSEEPPPTIEAPPEIEAPAIPETPTEPVEETPSTGRGPLEVVPLAGLGPVDFGMKKDQLIQAFGQPDRIEAQGIAMYYLESKGVHFILDFRRGVKEINCWSNLHSMALPGMTTFAGKTDKGVGMGNTREQIIAAYGEPARTETRGTIDILHYDDLRIQFALEQGKLVNITLRAPW